MHCLVYLVVVVLVGTEDTLDHRRGVDCEVKFLPESEEFLVRNEAVVVLQKGFAIVSAAALEIIRVTVMW